MHALAEYGSSSDSEDHGRMGDQLQGKCCALAGADDGASMDTPSFTSQTPGSREVTLCAPRVSGAYVSRRKRTKTDGESANPSADTGIPSATITHLLNRDRDCNSKRRRLAGALPKSCETLPREHHKPVVSLDWHCTNSTLLLSCSLDGTKRLWDVTQKKCVQMSSQHSGAAISCGRWLTHNTTVTGGYDSCAILTDVEKNEVITSFGHRDYVSALQVHPVDRNLVFSGDYGANVFSWDLRTGKTVRQYTGAGGRILDMALLQSGNELLASSDIVRRNASSQALRVWEVESAVATSNQIYPEPYTCPCIRAHPCRNEFYAQSNANYIVIFSSRKPYKCNKRKRFESHRVDGNKVQFDISPDGRLLCSASADGQVVLYDCDTSRSLKTLHVSDSCCVAVAWNQHSSSVVAVSDWSTNICVIK